MSNEIKTKNGPADGSDHSSEALRRQAEQRARGLLDEYSEALSAAEARRLLHEVRVHQIELEMQNQELRQAEAALESSRARYFHLYDLAPIGYLTLDSEVIQEANLRASRLLGIPRDALVKQSLVHLVVREDRDVFYLHRRRLFETGEPQTSELPERSPHSPRRRAAA